MLALGIGLGLAAAFCQSLSYLATRAYVQPRQGGSRTLLVLSHVMMGAVSAAILPFIWPGQPLPWHSLIGPLIWVSVFYLAGQLALMLALRHAEPSRISPMLAFKLVFLALMVTVLTSEPLTSRQWLAVGLTIVGAVALNYTGGASHPMAAIAALLACMAYSLSDWNIARLVTSLHGLELWRAFVWATLACYVVCGLLALLFLPAFGSRRMKDWLDAAPFAASWLLAMLFLFSCFGVVGVVYGNILQSTRGLMSVVMGSMFAAWGLLHIEQFRTRGVVLRRLAAAGLMVAAVILYAWKPAASPAAPQAHQAASRLPTPAAR